MGTQQLQNKDVLAYTLKDRAFGEFNIQKSANAWWIDKGKLERLVEAFKMDSTVKEACIMAGISEDQLKYFKEVHPEFSPIIEVLRALPVMFAKKKVVEAMRKDVSVAKWYLERRRPDEFGRNTKGIMNSLHAMDMRERIAADRERYTTIESKQVI